MNIYTSITSRKRGALLKHSHFYEIYSDQFARFSREKVRVLEIGVYNGGSLYMWRNFFENAEKIVGIDIDPYCKRWQDRDENIFVEIGDQTDVEFLKHINDEYGPFDIIIDDGGHENNQIITSFNVLFPLLNNEGIYVVEDTYHSYWPDYSCDRDKSTELYYADGTLAKGGKPLKINKTKSDITAMEYLKSLTDKMNVAAYIDGSKEAHDAGYNKVYREPDEFEKSIFSISFFDNVCFIHKTVRDGHASFGVSEWIGHNAEVPDDKDYE
jgi:hypothetical protein